MPGKHFFIACVALLLSGSMAAAQDSFLEEFDSEEQMDNAVLAPFGEDAFGTPIYIHETALNFTLPVGDEMIGWENLLRHQIAERGDAVNAYGQPLRPRPVFFSSETGEAYVAHLRIMPSQNILTAVPGALFEVYPIDCERIIQGIKTKQYDQLRAESPAYDLVMQKDFGVMMNNEICVESMLNPVPLQILLEMRARPKKEQSQKW